MVRFRVEQIDHVEMFVPDRYAAAEWYDQLLGLQVVREFEGWAADRGGPLMISSDGGGTKLALFEGVPPAGREIAGFRRVAFRTDAEAFVAFLGGLADVELTDHTGRRVTRELAVDHDQAFSIYFNDPYGHHLEVTTYDADAVRRHLA